MSYTNYENNFISSETEKFTAEETTDDIEETAILLVTKSLAEANAEEILDIVLNDAFDRVCPLTPGYLQLHVKYDKPIANILSVLEMETNLPVKTTSKVNFHTERSNESGDESLEEPVFTSPIYVKSGPENISILEESGISESCNMAECTLDRKQQLHDGASFASEKLTALENIAECEEGSSMKENDQVLCANSDYKNINYHVCANLSKSEISGKEDSAFLENIGDANEAINTVEKVESKSSDSEQKVSIAGKVIGDVVPDLNDSVDVEPEIHLQPQIVQAYVLYPESSAKAEDTITAESENTLSIEMEDDFALNNLNKDENTPSASNEANVETPLLTNDVGNLLNYFEQVNNTVDLRVQIVEVSSDKGNSNGTICEAVKLAVKEIAAAVFEGRGDGASTELSNMNIQLANRQERITPEIQLVQESPDRPTDQFWITQADPQQSQSTSNSGGTSTEISNPSMQQADHQEQTSPEIHAITPDQTPNTDRDQSWSGQMDPEQTQSMPNSDREELIAVHETLSADSDLQDYWSDRNLLDEMDETEVQVIQRDDDGETESLNGAAFDSGSPLATNYLAVSGADSQEDLDDFDYRSENGISISLKRSFLNTSTITKVVDETYTLKKMATNMEKKNPKIKANLTIAKLRSSRQALGQIKNDEMYEEIEENEETKETCNKENKENKSSRKRWHRVRNLLSCFKGNNNRQSSEEH